MASDSNNVESPEPSLTTWSDFLERYGEPEDDPAADEPIETDDSSFVGFRFKRREMGIYGKYPASETFQIVECRICHQIILVQSFRSHFILRHMQVGQNPKSQVSGVRQLSSSRIRKHSDDTPVSVPAKLRRHNSIGSSQPVRSLASKLEKKGYIVDEQVTVVESGNRNERIRMKSPVISRVILHNNSVYSGKGEKGRHKGSTPNTKRKSALPPPNMQQVLSLGYDPNRHCGVWMSDQKKHCLRSLTCKTHGLGLRRAVAGRAKQFDILLAEHRFRSNQMKEEEMKSMERDSQVSLKNHVIDTPSSPTKKSSSKKELRTPVSTVSDVSVSARFGSLLDKVLEKSELTVSLSQPQPAALCHFGGYRLDSGHVMFGSLEDRMRSHLVQLQQKDNLRPTAKPSNLGKPLDLQEDKSEYKINRPALPHHPLPVHHPSDGSQTPQPHNEGPTSTTTDSTFPSTSITNGFDLGIMMPQGNAMNCQSRQTETQRKSQVNSWPMDSTGCIPQFQINRQMNGDVALEQLQSSLAYPITNGLLAPVIDVQQIIVKQPGKPLDAQGVTNVAIAQPTSPSLNHTINHTAVIPSQPLSPNPLSAQYHTQLIQQQQQLQLQLLQGNHLDPQQQLLSSQQSPPPLCLGPFAQAMQSFMLQQQVMKLGASRKPGKLDFSVKHQSLQTDSIAGADLLPFSSLPVAVEASADSYHCQSPLMHVTPMPSLSSPASITPSSTLVQCPDLLSTAVPPGSQ